MGRKVKHASLDWPADPHSDTIRWRPSADPGQKSETGGRISSRGLTPGGPLQKTKRELLRDNPTRVADIAEWRSVLRETSEADPGFIERDLQRALRNTSP